MSMSPEVSAQRRQFKRKQQWRSCISIGTFMLFIVAVVGALGWSAYSLLSAGHERRAQLVAAMDSSEPHRFVVQHWLECTNGFFKSRTTCYASIREIAKPRGEQFVRDVDAAVLELGLIKE